MPSQNDRVLARLRQGPVAAVEFQPPNVCDGGAPIWRVAARIDVLKSRGHAITSERRPDGTAVYRLVNEPDLPKPSGERPVGIPGGVPIRVREGGAQPARDVSASAHGHSDGSLFDAAEFTDQASYRDAA